MWEISKTTQYNYLQTIYKCAQGEELQPWLSTEIRKQCVQHWILCEEMFANSLELQTGTLVLLYNLLALARRQRRDQRVGTRFSGLWSAGTPWSCRQAPKCSSWRWWGAEGMGWWGCRPSPAERVWWQALGVTLGHCVFRDCVQHRGGCSYIGARVV